MKQAEREDTWSRVNAQAESVFKDDDSMKGFLNFMANCTPRAPGTFSFFTSRTLKLPTPHLRQMEGSRTLHPFRRERIHLLC